MPVHALMSMSFAAPLAAHGTGRRDRHVLWFCKIVGASEPLSKTKSCTLMHGTRGKEQQVKRDIKLENKLNMLQYHRDTCIFRNINHRTKTVMGKKDRIDQAAGNI